MWGWDRKKVSRGSTLALTRLAEWWQMVIMRDIFFHPNLPQIMTCILFFAHHSIAHFFFIKSSRKSLNTLRWEATWWCHFNITMTSHFSHFNITMTSHFSHFSITMTSHITHFKITMTSYFSHILISPTSLLSYISNRYLTLNAPIATKVVCFSRLLKCLRSLYGKQCGSRSDCSNRSSLFWVHAVCFCT